MLNFRQYRRAIAATVVGLLVATSGAYAADTLYTVVGGAQKRLKDMGDDSKAEVIAPSVRSDSLDSTTTPLNNGASYTGSSKSVGPYRRLTGICFTDQNATLYIDQSINGTNWDYSTSVSVTASTGAAYSVEVVGAYARLRISNASGSNQTALRAAMYGKGS